MIENSMINFYHDLINEVSVLLIDDDKEFVNEMIYLLESHEYKGDALHQKKIHIELIFCEICFIFTLDFIDMVLVILFLFCFASIAF